MFSCLLYCPRPLLQTGPSRPEMLIRRSWCCFRVESTGWSSSETRAQRLIYRAAAAVSVQAHAKFLWLAGAYPTAIDRLPLSDNTSPYWPWNFAPLKMSQKGASAFDIPVHLFQKKVTLAPLAPTALFHLTTSDWAYHQLKKKSIQTAYLSWPAAETYSWCPIHQKSLRKFCVTKTIESRLICSEKE